MWLAIAAVLFVLWMLGFGVFHVAGGFIHVLLVLAVIAWFWQRRTAGESSSWEARRASKNR